MPSQSSNVDFYLRFGPKVNRQQLLIVRTPLKKPAAVSTLLPLKDSTDRLSKALVGERELIKVVCYYSSSNGSSWDGNL